MFKYPSKKAIPLSKPIVRAEENDFSRVYWLAKKMHKQYEKYFSWFMGTEIIKMDNTLALKILVNPGSFDSVTHSSFKEEGISVYFSPISSSNQLGRALVPEETDIWKAFEP